MNSSIAPAADRRGPATNERPGSAMEVAAAFLKLASNVSAGAQAVGGYDQVLCNTAPLLVCNPFEENGMSHYEATQALVNASKNPAGQRK